ncbi:MAG TPA: ROK family protein [Bryobacteraceae bacterium]|nr:ROK family protein [Bryobacteraceae bacterium]
MYKVSDAWLRKILTVLYERRQTTRAEIIQATRLNVASVSQGLRHLIEAGVVRKLGQLPSAAGRRRDYLEISSEAAYFLAVDLEGTRVRFGLASFLGDILHRWEEPFAREHPLGMDTLIKGFEVVQERLTAQERARVLAIGVSYSGVMDRDRRVTAVNLGWNEYPLADNLRDATGLPVFLGTECLTKLLAERWLGMARDCGDFIYVTIGNGVGVACMVDGRVLSGRDGFAGEFGHMNVDPNARERCNCGNTGCLEAVVSSPGMVRCYLELANGDGRVQWDQVTEVFDLARSGEPHALAVVDRAGHDLGVGLANIANLLNPELIVLGGDVLHAPDLFLPRVVREIDAHTLPKIRRGLEVKCSSMGFDIGLVGAASLAFHDAIQDTTLLHRIVSRPPRPRRKRRTAAVLS